jgi:hypothetical protein
MLPVIFCADFCLPLTVAFASGFLGLPITPLPVNSFCLTGILKVNSPLELFCVPPLQVTGTWLHFRLRIDFLPLLFFFRVIEISPDGLTEPE